MNCDDLNACADLVRRSDPERFLAAMAAPVAARGVLFPIYAFNAEVARAPWVTEEPMIAEMRLQWWHDVLEEIREGAPVRRHEVATPLSQVLDIDATQLLDDLILARRWDAYRDAHEDDAALQRYLTHTGGHLMWVAARALGAHDALKETVLKIGYAQGLAGYLRAIPTLEAKQRVPLVDGRPEAVQAMVGAALSDLATARKGLGRLAKPARAALLPGWNSRAILRRARKDPARVGAGALEIAPLTSRLLLMGHALKARL